MGFNGIPIVRSEPSSFTSGEGRAKVTTNTNYIQENHDTRNIVS